MCSATIMDQICAEAEAYLESNGRSPLVQPASLAGFIESITEATVEAQKRTVSVDAVPNGWRILDIGPETVELFAQYLRTARTVVWNGPMGVFELEPFAAGTFAMAHALAKLAGATTIIGGGDSSSAAERAGVAKRITHISTGGGAALEFLEGMQLPGVALLLSRTALSATGEKHAH